MATLRQMWDRLTAMLPGLGLSPKSKTDLQTRFHLFQEVLANNNKALEIITDMGEKLSGSYIFDTRYLHNSYQDLTATIRASIASFNTLTNNTYPIAEAFARVDILIEAMLHDRGSTGAELVIPYGEIQWDRARDVGGKNFHLADLGNTLKLPVPDGFALTGRAFDKFLKANGLTEMIARLQGEGPGEELLAGIASRIQTGEIPAALAQGIDKALATIQARHGAAARLAVRSSAEEEDDFFSFAGQFETVLNVPLQRQALFAAYKTVLASLFSPEAAIYQQRMGYATGGMRMPVGFLLMVDAVASGVMYTADPVRGDKGLILINAAWGLGPSVVDGTTDPDLYLVRKGARPKLIETTIGGKERMTVLDPGQGITETSTPTEQRSKRCLDEEKVLELARHGMAIEAYFKGPQDVEWALSAGGALYILQARPLKLSDGDKASTVPTSPSPGEVVDYPILMQNKGIVVRKGIAAGKAFVLKHIADLDSFPKGSVLVAAHDSPQFIRVMPFVAAIITDIGALASHMASVCREFKIPTLVNTGQASQCLRHGQEITLECDDEGNSTVYGGIVGPVLARRGQAEVKMEELFEFRCKKYLLRYISPLNLVNPLEEEFSPGKCRTLHDVLRFMHEKSIQQVIASSQASGARRSNLFRLELSVPEKIQVVDLGGGVSPNSDRSIGLAQVTSLPLKAILSGMTHPGAWHDAPVALEIKDFMGSMTRMPDLGTGAKGFTEDNFAIASKEYVNLSLRFGYHFNLVDSYCSERAANNHVYFRFVGGATEIVKRSRRLRFIDQVLREHGFISKTKGDFIIARTSHIEQDEVLRILDMSGRLIAFTRQLDADLRSDDQIETYVQRFLAGNYQRD